MIHHEVKHLWVQDLVAKAAFENLQWVLNAADVLALPANRSEFI